MQAGWGDDGWRQDDASLWGWPLGVPRPVGTSTEVFSSVPGAGNTVSHGASRAPPVTLREPWLTMGAPQGLLLTPKAERGAQASVPRGPPFCLRLRRQVQVHRRPSRHYFLLCPHRHVLLYISAGAGRSVKWQETLGHPTGVTRGALPGAALQMLGVHAAYSQWQPSLPTPPRPAPGTSPNLCPHPVRSCSRAGALCPVGEGFW